MPITHEVFTIFFASTAANKIQRVVLIIHVSERTSASAHTCTRSVQPATAAAVVATTTTTTTSATVYILYYIR